MGQYKKFKVVNVVGTTEYRDSHPGYVLYKARDDSTYSAPDTYILTREKYGNGQMVTGDEGDDFLDPMNHGRKSNAHDNKRLYIYRPQAALDSFYRVKDIILSRDLHVRFKGDGVDPHKHHLFEARRPIHPQFAGYLEEGKLSFIFSAANGNIHDHIPRGELKALSAPYDLREHDHFLHNDADYKARVWAAVKAVCG